MNKEKILKTLKSKVAIGVISGVVCFGWGVAAFSDNDTIEILQKEKIDLTNKLKTELDEKDAEISKKDIEIKSLQTKVAEAKPWFDEKRKEEETRLAEEAKIAAEKAKIDAETKAKVDAEEQATKEAQGVNTSVVKRTVESTINTELNDQVKDTKLTSLTINENLGTESNNKDVVVLGDLSWSVKNGEKTTKEMIKMYSDHLSAKLASKVANDSEIVFFWKAEYTGLDIKHSYYVKDGNAYKQ